MWRCPSRPARFLPRAWLGGVGVSASGGQGRRGGWLGGRTSAPRPKCRRCLELYRAGPRSWRSSSTCARAVMVCVRPAGEDGGAFAALFEAEWLQGRKVQQNTGTQLLLKILRERKKADGAVKRGRGLADGMAKREDGRPSPEGWQRPGPCRAGLCSWRSSFTSALLPAVLEEDRAGAPGRVHLGYPHSPEGGREDHAAGPGARGPRGRGAAVALPGLFPPGAVKWDTWT